MSSVGTITFPDDSWGIEDRTPDNRRLLRRFPGALRGVGLVGLPHSVVRGIVLYGGVAGRVVVGGGIRCRFNAVDVRRESPLTLRGCWERGTVFQTKQLAVGEWV